MQNNYKKWGFLIITLLAVSTTFIITKASISAENLINVCISKNGTLNILETNSTCKNNERLLSWNIQGIKGEKGERGEQGPVGPQGPSGSIDLPEELKPVVTDLNICKQRQGNGVAFYWNMNNSYGNIPAKSANVDYDGSGVSWGITTINSGLAPNYNTYVLKSNGFQYSLSFPISENIGNESPIKMEGNVFWNGFNIPISYEGVWSENLPQCMNERFAEGF